MAFQPSSLPTLNPSDGTGNVLHRGFRGPDPFAPRERPGANFVNAVLATALFRCWHLLMFLGAWSTLVTVLNQHGHNLHFSNTLLTVVGTVLGFVISYRTTSSFERYNEGRRLWSSIVFASRTFSRTVWFHVTDPTPLTPALADTTSARSLIEKKSVLNLLEAFAASVKHYLRGEDGIYYQDLYYLVKFLPAYALPAGMSMGVAHQTDTTAMNQSSARSESDAGSDVDEKDTVTSSSSGTSPTFATSETPSPDSSRCSHRDVSNRDLNTSSGSRFSTHTHDTRVGSASEDTKNGDEHLEHTKTDLDTDQGEILPRPITSSALPTTRPGFKKARFLDPIRSYSYQRQRSTHTSSDDPEKHPKPPGRPLQRGPSLRTKVLLPRADEKYLLPSRMPPKLKSLNCFPLTAFIEWLARTRVGRKLGMVSGSGSGRSGVEGRRERWLRKRMKKSTISHNLPLEITLYLSSYIAAVQERKQADVPTLNLLFSSLNQLVESLTALERILTTPIPFSYSFHLWMVTLVYCFFLPCQIWPTFGWLTIPGTVVVCFMFLGFLAAGEEIENPFGYDRNDLNLDHFTQNIIPNELRALTSAPPPHPATWAFSPQNDLLFCRDGDWEAMTEGEAGNGGDEERVTPAEWLERGRERMISAMSA